MANHIRPWELWGASPVDLARADARTTYLYCENRRDKTLRERYEDMLRRETEERRWFSNIV